MKRSNQWVANAIGLSTLLWPQSYTVQKGKRLDFSSYIQGGAEKWKREHYLRSHDSLVWYQRSYFVSGGGMFSLWPQWPSAESWIGNVINGSGLVLYDQWETVNDMIETVAHARHDVLLLGDTTARSNQWNPNFILMRILNSHRRKRLDTDGTLCNKYMLYWKLTPGTVIIWLDNNLRNIAGVSQWGKGKLTSRSLDYGIQKLSTLQTWQGSFTCNTFHDFPIHLELDQNTK